MDYVILIIYTICLIFIFSASIIKLLENICKAEPLSRISLLILIFFIHSGVLAIFTFARSPELSALLYSIKDFLFAPTLYFYSIYFVKTQKNWVDLTTTFAICTTVISVIYVFEFIGVVYFGQDLMAYTQKLRALLVENQGLVNYTFASEEVDGLRLLRLEGPIGHNNATSLIVALGAIASFSLYQWKNKTSFLMLAVLHVSTLTLMAARTSILAFILSVIAWRMFVGTATLSQNERVQLKRRRVDRNVKYALLVTAGCALVYFGPMSYLYAPERLLAPLMYFISLPELTDFGHVLMNPLKWFGLGFPVISNVGGEFNIIRSDDLFFIQLLSMYGPASLILLFALIISLVQACRRTSFSKFEVPAKAMGFHWFFIPLFSTLHSGSLTRPQIFQFVFFGLALLMASNSWKKQHIGKAHETHSSSRVA